eukprot:Lithocolla_globosa_v1_NODE_785_length_3283_cov_3.234201.p2 type:complete len:133 gc:universal NODE_785_length_3283_cov_3.234201:2884-3282(+)
MWKRSGPVKQATPPNCRRYGREPETIHHLYGDCQNERAKEVRQGLMNKLDPQRWCQRLQYTQGKKIEKILEEEMRGRAGRQGLLTGRWEREIVGQEAVKEEIWKGLLEWVKKWIQEIWKERCESVHEGEENK